VIIVFFSSFFWTAPRSSVWTQGESKHSENGTVSGDKPSPIKKAGSVGLGNSQKPGKTHSTERTSELSNRISISLATTRIRFGNRDIQHNKKQAEKATVKKATVSRVQAGRTQPKKQEPVPLVREIGKAREPNSCSKKTGW